MLSISTDISLLKDSNFTIVDIEVTGIGKTDRILEIGALKVSDGKITNHFHSFIKPDFEIDKNVFSFIDFSEKDLKNAPSVSWVLTSIKDLVGNDPLIINNAPFALFYFNNELAGLNIELNNNVIDLCTIINSPRPKKLEKYDVEINIPKKDNYSVNNALIAIEEIIRKSGAIK
jgi:DNA polymerase III alpha subunit (gram-positive type)